MIIKKLIKKITERDENPVIVSNQIEKFTDAHRILLLRQDRIGDILVSVAFIKKLRSLFPSAEIDVVLSHKNNSAFMAISSFVNRKYVLEKGFFKYLKLINILRKEKYDVVIDMLDNASSTSSLLTRFTPSELKLGFDKKNKKVYSHIVPIPDKRDNHITKRQNTLLIPFIGNMENEKTLSINMSDHIMLEATKLLGRKNEKIRFGVNLTGSNKSKNWGTGNYIAFLKSLKNNSNLDLRVFTTKNNQKQLKEILNVIPNINAPFVKSFELFAAMISTCDVILTPDTSVVHLCSAYNIPCLALYTYSDNPNVGMPWEPLSKHSKVIKISDKQSLGLIKVTDVLEALKQIIEEISD